MNVTVLLSSGLQDEWANVAEAVAENGDLMILAHIEGDEVPGGMKTVTLSRTVDQGMDLPPLDKDETFMLLAIYASGMWMRVEFDAGE